MEKKKYSPLGKRYNWTERTKGIIYEFIVTENHKRLDRFIFNTSKKGKEILELLRLKYGFNYK